MKTDTRFEVIVDNAGLHEALKPAWSAMNDGDGSAAVLAQIYLPADQYETRVRIQGVLLPSTEMTDEAQELIRRACKSPETGEDNAQ